MAHKNDVTIHYTNNLVFLLPLYQMRAFEGVLLRFERIISVYNVSIMVFGLRDLKK